MERRGFIRCLFGVTVLTSEAVKRGDIYVSPLHGRDALAVVNVDTQEVYYNDVVPLHVTSALITGIPIGATVEVRVRHRGKFPFAQCLPPGDRGSVRPISVKDRLYF